MLAGPPDMLDEALEALEGVERAYNDMRDLAKEACEGLHTRERRAALQKDIEEIHVYFCRAAEKAAGIAAKHGARFGGAA